MTERQLLEAAREGDEGAFGALVEQHRGGLYVHCYRMLGSPQDAEDALQEALLRAWRALPRFEGRSSLRSWLYAIATNASLRALERRPARLLPMDFGPAAGPHDTPGEPLTEVPWLAPLPDAALPATDPGASPDARYEQRESVELAFVAALQLLPPRQRAVLILREVLGFSGEEVAGALGTSAASVYSALQRAHKTIDARLPAQSQQAALAALSDAELRELVAKYVDAWERADVAALAALLTEDVVLSMPPHSLWLRGREDVAAFLGRRPLADDRRWASTPTRANGQLAFVQQRLEDDGTPVPHTPHVTVVDVRDGRVAAITAFLDEELFARFLTAG